MKNTDPEEREFSIEEIEEAAKEASQKGGVIPENLDAPGRMLFLGLFRLYNLSKLNLIDKDVFECTQRRLIKDYEENSFYCRMWRSLLKKIQKASTHVSKATKEKSYEEAMTALDIIYGIKH